MKDALTSIFMKDDVSVRRVLSCKARTVGIAYVDALMSVAIPISSTFTFLNPFETRSFRIFGLLPLRMSDYTSLLVSPRKKRSLPEDDDNLLTPKRLRLALVNSCLLVLYVHKCWVNTDMRVPLLL